MARPRRAGRPRRRSGQRDVGRRPSRCDRSPCRSSGCRRAPYVARCLVRSGGEVVAVRRPVDVCWVLRRSTAAPRPGHAPSDVVLGQIGRRLVHRGGEPANRSAPGRRAARPAQLGGRPGRGSEAPPAIRGRLRAGPGRPRAGGVRRGRDHARRAVRRASRGCGAGVRARLGQMARETAPAPSPRFEMPRSSNRRWSRPTLRSPRPTGLGHSALAVQALEAGLRELPASLELQAMLAELKISECRHLSAR